MIALRLVFYVLYVVLGVVIVVRLAALGLRAETISGLLLGAALITLGSLRIAGYLRARSAQRR